MGQNCITAIQKTYVSPLHNIAKPTKNVYVQEPPLGVVVFFHDQPENPFSIS